MTTAAWASSQARRALGDAGLADVRAVHSRYEDDGRVRTHIELAGWDHAAAAVAAAVAARIAALAKLPNVDQVNADADKGVIIVWRWPTAELRLTGTAVQTLADYGHVPGWPGKVSPDLVPDGDPERDLHRATASWYSRSRSTKVGRGTVHLGPATARQCRAILEYLESVAGALCSSEDADAKREGRAVGRAVDQAVSHLRRQGVPVVERQRGPFVDYEVGPVTTS
jgi:hypothetical protein